MSYANKIVASLAIGFAMASASAWADGVSYFIGGRASPGHDNRVRVLSTTPEHSAMLKAAHVGTQAMQNIVEAPAARGIVLAGSLLAASGHASLSQVSACADCN